MTKPPHPEFSIVVPVRDEAGNIAPLLTEIAAAMAGLEGAPAYEVIYVDDGSRDGTAEELAHAAQAEAALTVLTHATGCGQSQALITGIGEARAEWIITLDGDGQNVPADIPKLLEARAAVMAEEPEWASDFLYVGHRLLRHDSLFRRYQSWFANDIRGWLLGDHTPDAGCGLKLFRKEMFLSLPRFNALHRFLPALFIRAGGRTVSVEVSHRPRTTGQSKYGLWRRLALSIVDIMGVMWLMARHTRPDTHRTTDTQ